ncbi:MAG: DNA polymerase I, partial [Chloroflexales bacterium]|nr:DNA polymerase I [Chloroflexales bacterium]
MTRRELLILVDGHALAFRAFHALAEQNLRASNGEPTYAVFGFTQIVLTALQERQPEYVAVSFDVGRTFRDDMYAEYKAGRVETPSEFHIQLDRMKQVLGALNIPIYTANGFEADDVIGTLSEQATAKNLDTLILTGDSDTLQLVNEQVHVLMAVPFPRGATKEYDLEAVVERYKGLGPKQLTDLRGLKGDTSDNIPGVKGIGEAGAIGLLNTYGTVEQLYDCLEGKADGCEPIPNRYRKHLEGQRKVAEFSKKLATIVCDVPVTLDLNAARLRDYDRKAVIELFQQLEFGMSLIKKLPGTGPSLEVADLPPPVAAPAAPAPSANGSDADSNAELLPPPPSDGPEQLTMFDLPEVASEFRAATGRAVPLVANLPEPVALPPAQGDYKTVATPEDLAEVIAALKVAPAFAFDTETDTLSSIEANLVGVSLSTRPGSAWYIPVGHREGAQLPREQVVAALKPFFEDSTLAKYGHNAKFDMEVLRGAGITVRGVTFDSTIVATLLNKQAGLKSLAFYELQLADPMIDIAELIGRGKAQVTFDHVPIDRAAPYAAADADMTLRLVEKLRPQLAQQERVEQIFQRLELPLIPVLVEMEANGIKLDVDYIRSLGGRLGERIAELEKTIYSLAGQEFNINSGQQLNEILFDKLKLNPAGLSKTKSGGYSLTAEVMEKLGDQNEVVRQILQYRQLSKLKSTYVDSLPDLINPHTGRIHTTYNQVGAATGRLSSTNPNLQNIPVRTEEGREIRRGFVAEQGCTFVAADYSQIELRVLAHITRDPTLVDVFVNDQDIHAATAAALFNVPLDKVDKNQRRVAKTVTFGIIYGISSFGLAPRIGTNRAEAQQLIDALFERYPGLRAYIDSTLDVARREGYVQSLFGRRR